MPFIVIDLKASYLKYILKLFFLDKSNKYEIAIRKKGYMASRVFSLLFLLRMKPLKKLLN